LNNLVALSIAMLRLFCVGECAQKALEEPINKLRDGLSIGSWPFSVETLEFQGQSCDFFILGYLSDRLAEAVWTIVMVKLISTRTTCLSRTRNIGLWLYRK
jgi:hypothetical protein